MLPGVPCLSVLLKSPKPLAVKEDAFVFSVAFSCRSFFVAFDMISVLIYAELKERQSSPSELGTAWIVQHVLH